MNWFQNWQVCVVDYLLLIMQYFLRLDNTQGVANRCTHIQQKYYPMGIYLSCGSMKKITYIWDSGLDVLKGDRLTFWGEFQKIEIRETFGQSLNKERLF